MKFDSDAAMRQAPQSVQHWYFECQERLKTTDPIILAGAIQACAIDQLSAEISLLNGKLFFGVQNDFGGVAVNDLSLDDLNDKIAKLESINRSLLQLTERAIACSRGRRATDLT
jgi:hypothetical protein